MKQVVLSLVICCMIQFVVAQSKSEILPGVYYSTSDTIKYNWSDHPDTFKMVLNRDTLNHGTDSRKGAYVTAFIGDKKLIIKADNYPYAKRTYVTVQTPRGRHVAIFRFNSSSGNFSLDYMREHSQKVSYELPEVYELANIIWSLSPGGKKDKSLNNGTDYFKKVENHFGPWLNHPIFSKLNFPENEYYQKYYEFRENSYMYHFSGNRIISKGIYNYVFGKDWENYTNLFSELLPLVEDFSHKSGFRKFYEEHKGFYEKAEQRVNALLPVNDMWVWLENEFPGRKFASYKIVFSPLIGGSHSTQQYSDVWKDKEWFREAIMFICGSDRYDTRPELTEDERKGLMSGIVFTEIDHNYVNPETNKYRNEVTEIFKDTMWSTTQAGMHYSSAISVFNEYMTHALFCVWVSEKFDRKTAEKVIAEREKMNVERRGFKRFSEFNAELLRLRKTNPSIKMAAVYPLILTWAGEQIK